MSSQSSAAAADSAVNGDGNGGKEIMLFGVRVAVDPMRKCVSLNNLSQYEQPNEANKNNSKEDDGNGDGNGSAAAGGYASADDAVPQGNGTRERKRGVPWSEEEHKLFLLGLQRVGKGDWRGISKNFVKTRTPTQVASHAQKYFLRRANQNRRRRRSSLFDITTETIAATQMKEELVHCQENTSVAHPYQPLQPGIFEAGGFSMMPAHPAPMAPVMPVPAETPMRNWTFECSDDLNNSSNEIVRPMPIFRAPENSMTLDLDLKLDLTMGQPKFSQNAPSSQGQSSGQSAIRMMSNFGKRDGIISVA